MSGISTIIKNVLFVLCVMKDGVNLCRVRVTMILFEEETYV